MTTREYRIQGYVARDEEGMICFYYEYPRNQENLRNKMVYFSRNDKADEYNALELPRGWFPDLVFDDGPISVTLTLTKSD